MWGGTRRIGIQNRKERLIKIGKTRVPRLKNMKKAGQQNVTRKIKTNTKENKRKRNIFKN